MAEILFGLVFKILNTITNILLAPLFAIVNPILSALGFSQYANAILTYFSDGMRYVNFFITLFHIPRAPLVAIFSLGATIFTFNISLRAIGLIIAIYGFFKGGPKSTS